jgi:hypothetical protein
MVRYKTLKVTFKSNHQHIKRTKSKHANITADAGYGSEQNYPMLEDKHTTAYVK